jgi:hypothetical protein
MKPRLYLETTIPSYLAAKPSRDLRLAADQQTTQEWWALRRGDFDLFVSKMVLREVTLGNPVYAAARVEKLKGIAVLSDVPLAAELAKGMLSDGIIPVVAANDAVHLGLAAAHGMDFLLTWNCRHLNNRALDRRIRRLCQSFGLDCPVICTPAELMIL